MSQPFWSNVGVAVQSALAAALTISAITKANPAVVTYTGTDPSNGDVVLLTMTSGMGQLNDRVVRLANVNGAANTAELEGVDSTTFDTFVSGSMEVITFGTTVSTLQSVSASGGEPIFADSSTIHENIERRVPVAYSGISFSFESKFDAADAGLVALKSAADALAKRAVRLTFSNGQKFYFAAYVGFSFAPGGQIRQGVTTPVTFEAQGRPTVYSS